MEPLAIRCLEDLESLNALGSAYRDFLHTCGDGELFCRPGWLRCLLPVYCPSPRRPVFLSVWRAGRMIGLLPLALETKPWTHGAVRRLSLLGQISGSLVSGRLGCRVAAGESLEAVVDALAGFLRGEFAPRWDWLDFGLMPEASEELAIWRRWFPAGRCTAASMSTPWLKLPATQQAYLQIFSRKKREEFSRLRRRLNEQGERVEWLGMSQLPPDDLAAIEQLHRSRQADLRQTGRARMSLFDHPAERDGFRALLRWAADEGCARHYLLKIEGRLASFILGFHAGGTYFACLTAMDPDYAAWSPSKMLFLHAIGQEIEQHSTGVMDLLPGDNFYKHQLATDVRRLVNWQAVNPVRPLAAVKVAWLRGGQAVHRLSAALKR